MNIIIFGPDNSGKTTLSEYLCQKYKNEGKECTVVHSPGPVEVDKLVDFMRTEPLEKSDERVKIFDRFPLIEESIYGPLVRGVNRLENYSDEVFSKIDKFIYCYPGIFRVVNWGEREQMDGVKDNIFDIINAYNKLAVDLKSKGYNVIEYNYAEHPEDKAIIIKALQDLEYTFKGMATMYSPCFEYVDLVSYINRINNLVGKISAEEGI